MVCGLGPALGAAQCPAAAAVSAAAAGSLATAAEANEASVLSWAPLLVLGVVLVLIGGMSRRHGRRGPEPELPGGAKVTPLQKPREPRGPAARTG